MSNSLRWCGASIVFSIVSFACLAKSEYERKREARESDVWQKLDQWDTRESSFSQSSPPPPESPQTTSESLTG